MITIVAEFKATDTEKFKKCAIDLVRESRKEKGNLAYKIYQDRKTPSEFTFIEEWLNDAAIEAHNCSKHFTKFLDDIKDITSGEPKIKQLTTLPSVFS